MIPQFRICNQENRSGWNTMNLNVFSKPALLCEGGGLHLWEGFFFFFTLRSVTDVIGIVILFNIYIQHQFCMVKHFGLYPPCSALCEAELWLGSLYFSWHNTLQKWHMQQPVLQTQVSWGSWKLHCPGQFGGHIPAKIEDSFVKLLTT